MHLSWITPVSGPQTRLDALIGTLQVMSETVRSIALWTLLLGNSLANDRTIRCMELHDDSTGPVANGAAAPGLPQEASDDEANEVSWEWIFSTSATARNDEAEDGDRKRRKVAGNSIVGARLGTFECRIGDTVLLKADGSNDAWVAMICEFVDDDGDGDMAANFMWFSTEKEIRNKDKKRSDFYWVRRPTLLRATETKLTTFRTSSTSLHPGT